MEKKEIDFGRVSRLRQLLEESKLNHEEFGIKCGYSKSVIDKLASGNRPLTSTQAENISKAFNVRYDWLYNHDRFKTETELHEYMISFYKSAVKVMDRFMSVISLFENIGYYVAQDTETYEIKNSVGATITISKPIFEDMLQSICDYAEFRIAKQFIPKTEKPATVRKRQF